MNRSEISASLIEPGNRTVNRTLLLFAVVYALHLTAPAPPLKHLLPELTDQRAALCAQLAAKTGESYAGCPSPKGGMPAAPQPLTPADFKDITDWKDRIYKTLQEED